MSHPDQKYIDALLTNNFALLHEAYKKFSGKIKLMILQHNGTEQDAADIFQEAWIAIYNMAKQKSFLLSGPLEPYLYTVCKNKWLTQLQKKGHAVVTTDSAAEYITESISFANIENNDLSAARKSLLLKKLAELGDTCRQLIAWSLTGKPMQEAAEKMGFTYSYARKKKSECMAKLSQLVKQAPEYNDLKWE